MFYVYLGYVRISCPLASYRAALAWARDFADSLEGKGFRAPLSIRTELDF